MRKTNVAVVILFVIVGVLTCYVHILDKELSQLELTVGDMQKEFNCIQNQYQEQMP